MVFQGFGTQRGGFEPLDVKPLAQRLQLKTLKVALFWYPVAHVVQLVKEVHELQKFEHWEHVNGLELLWKYPIMH